MGARQSRRSVDITTTPKKEGAAAEGAVSGEAAEKIEKLGAIEEVPAAVVEAKPTSNGTATHAEAVDDKEKDNDEATDKDKDNEVCNLFFYFFFLFFYVIIIKFDSLSFSRF